ncbi:hypothetical protein HDU98_000761 [Podochytrium sp. JEL0797]|nr:hypothetical protein HDU98_000761 [Podochytrium sp. JEL0797]
MSLEENDPDAPAHRPRLYGGDPFLQTRVPAEIVQMIFALVHPSQAFKFKRVCRRINQCLSASGFAALNLAAFLGSTAGSETQSTEFVGLQRLWLKWPESYQVAYTSRAMKRLEKLSWIDATLRRLGGLCKITSRRGGPNRIPHCIGQLQNLTFLKLNYLSLKGDIPVELAHLINLETVNLSFNSLSGSIPAGISALTKLRVLNLGSNFLAGELPSELFALSAMRSLKLHNNGFTGPLSSDLKQLQQLENLELGHNSFTGGIPSEFPLGLYFLDLSHNNFSGPIPPGLGELLALRYLFLHNNRFSGVLPVELGSLLDLDMTCMKGNGLTIPDGVDVDGNHVWTLIKTEK